MNAWHSLAAMVVFASLAVADPRAADVGGMQLDDKVSLAGRQLALNGAGVRTRVWFKVYVASLYLPQKGRDLAAVLAAVSRRVQLNMLRALSADQLVDALNEGLEANNTPAELSAIRKEVE